MLDNCDEDELGVRATPPMLRFSTLTSTLFRGHSGPPNKCPLLPPSYVCNSAVIACIMAMVGKGCGRTCPESESIYRALVVRVFSSSAS